LAWTEVKAACALVVAVPMILLSVASPAGAIEIEPHRALYRMSLMRASGSSGVVAADGTMQFSWAATCDGWTIEQRYKLHMQYAEQDDTDLNFSFLAVERRDGRRYRFTIRKQREADQQEELRGDARSGPKGGEARFTKPEDLRVALPPGTLFPGSHTLRLIDAARAGKNFLSERVFDGGSPDGPDQVTAAIGRVHSAQPDESVLLRKRWWPVRLAFFPADTDSIQPDYELGMELAENGVARSMVLDYGTFVIRAKLDKIEPLTKPPC
jgi:hypothetical protein